MRKARSFFAAAAILGIGGALASACGSSSSPDTSCEGTSCDVPDGSIKLPDGAIVPADSGPTGFPPGSTVLPDGGVLLPDGAVVPPGTGVGPCTPGTTQCTNCKDDDGDGKIDWMDPECTGPLDNDESSFATGIPGDNIDACKQDCWFDGNSGSGDDQCLWDLRCSKATENKDCPFDEKIVGTKECAAPSDFCKKFCEPLTPKGCDCFGCCSVFDAAGVEHTVKLVSTCSVAALGDPTKCPTCTKSADCGEPCGHCDYCLGKVPPPDCYPSAPDAGPDAPADAPPYDAAPPPPPGTCDPSTVPCDAAHPCASGAYCLTGCCMVTPR
jgi:hypothetical protein